MKDFLKASGIAISAILIQSLVFFITRNLGLEAELLNWGFDDATPFIPHFIYFYFTWFVLLYLVPVVLYYKDKEMLRRYIILSFVANIVLCVTYIIYPTTIYRPNVEVDGISTWLVNFIYKADLPVRNCFPSAHCLYSLLFIYSVFKTKKLSFAFKSVVYFLSIMVIPTVLFIKQHVLVDVIGAFIYFGIILIIGKFLFKTKLFKKTILK